MSVVPENLRYTADHEWVRRDADGSVIVGITDHAQQQLGELVYVELPEVGRVLEVREASAVVESVKAASDVYAPIAGRVIAVNEALAAEPGLVNTSPYEQGWLLRLQPAGTGEESLLDAATYQRRLDAAD